MASDIIHRHVVYILQGAAVRREKHAVTQSLQLQKWKSSSKNLFFFTFMILGEQISSHSAFLGNFYVLIF
jgi:hypothetical protein